MPAAEKTILLGNFTNISRIAALACTGDGFRIMLLAVLFNDIFLQVQMRSVEGPPYADKDGLVTGASPAQKSQK
jgi:hypothetical protein